VGCRRCMLAAHRAIRLLAGGWTRVWGSVLDSCCTLTLPPPSSLRTPVGQSQSCADVNNAPGGGMGEAASAPAGPVAPLPPTPPTASGDAAAHVGSKRPREAAGDGDTATGGADPDADPADTAPAAKRTRLDGDGAVTAVPPQSASIVPLTDEDPYLGEVMAALRRVHAAYYDAVDAQVAAGRDVKAVTTRAIVPRVLRGVLAGCCLAFSSVFPVNRKPERSRLWHRCLAAGAVLADGIPARALSTWRGALPVESLGQAGGAAAQVVTHLVARADNTVKVAAAVAAGNVCIVTLEWLVESLKRYRAMPTVPYSLPRRPEAAAVVPAPALVEALSAAVASPALNALADSPDDESASPAAPPALDDELLGALGRRHAAGEGEDADAGDWGAEAARRRRLGGGSAVQALADGAGVTDASGDEEGGADEWMLKEADLLEAGGDDGNALEDDGEEGGGGDDGEDDGVEDGLD